MRTSRVHALSRIVMVSLVTLVAVTAGGADDADKPEKPGKGPAEFKSLKYRLVGPAVGGRVSRAVGVPGNPLVYYAATASGGVWKSEDGGIAWKSIWDDQPISSIGSIAVAPSDPNVIYVGAGEANIRGNVAAGNGIYKSTDAGKTWTHVWKQEGQIGTMVVHPKNADIAFAAVLGHAFGPNPERGVYRTKDGGKTWQQVLKKDADTGASDVCIDVSNPSRLFAGLWQARRTPWSMTSAGPGGGFYASKDGGDTWKQLKGSGLPEKGLLGKIGCGVAPSDGRRVYALIEAEEGGLFRSDDGGGSWDRVSDHHALRQRPWYYTTLTIDPTNPDIVWFPQVPLLRTIDGGKTIRRIRGPHHGDHHDIWIDPQNPKRIINANDGGVDLTWNGGETWYAPPLPIAQFYHVSVDNSTPYHVHGAMQDLGTARGPSDSLEDGITNGHWTDVGGGEAGHTASDPGNPDVVWAGEYMGIITRYDHRTGMARHVSIYPENGSGHGAENLKYRFQWTAPIVVSPHDGNTVYHAGNVLFRTTDGGLTWTAISPDLTRNDKSKQKWSGGPVTGDNTGVEWYCTIFAVAESAKEKGLIWAGSDDGLVHVTRDGGGKWTNVTPRGAPEWGTVSLIEASPHDPGTAYVVYDAHRLDDMKPYLYRTTDYGKSWKSLASGLPQEIYLHAVREDPKKKGMLYLGTERGVSFSRDDGATWQFLGLNFPTVAVHDLQVKEDDLVVGTHGRSIWIFDDLSVVRDWTKEIGDRPVHLFAARPATRWEERSSFHEDGPGENPPRGAVITYSLKGKIEEDIRLDILDRSDKVIRTITSKKEEPEVAEDDPDGGPRKKAVLTREPGVQRVVWNLRTDGAMKIKGAKSEGNPEGAIQVPPGTYTARLTVGKTILSTPVEVRPDPRLGLTPADLEAQSKFVGDIQAQVTRLSTVVTQIQSVRDQLKVKIAALKGSDKSAEWIKEAEAVIGKCDAIEAKLHNSKAEVEYDILAKGAMLYSRLTTLLMYTLSGSGAPTQGQREVFDIQRGELDRLDAEWRSLLNEQVMEVARKADTLAPGGIAVPGR